MSKDDELARAVEHMDAGSCRRRRGGMEATAAICCQRGHLWQSCVCRSVSATAARRYAAVMHHVITRSLLSCARMSRQCRATPGAAQGAASTTGAPRALLPPAGTRAGTLRVWNAIRMIHLPRKNPPRNDLLRQLPRRRTIRTERPDRRAARGPV